MYHFMSLLTVLVGTAQDPVDLVPQRFHFQLAQEALVDMENRGWTLTLNYGMLCDYIAAEQTNEPFTGRRKFCSEAFCWELGRPSIDRALIILGRETREADGLE